MSLPTNFETPLDYFNECTEFFRKYEFLYNFANTEILIRNILDKITFDVEKIEISQNFDLKQIENEFLSTFFTELAKFRPNYDGFIEDVSLDEVFDAPLSPKKKHEIVYLAREIKRQYVGECDVVVDFGSGLGYLDQFIYQTTKLKVLGLECNETNYVGAKKRQTLYHENSKDHVKYIRHTVTPKSSSKIDEFVKDKFPNSVNFGITGLHSCADLTVDAIDIFLKSNLAKHLIIMPCCYHKMAQNEGHFKNFPLSGILKKVFKEKNGNKFLKVPFLRLGAQPPEVTDTLENSVFNLLARAVLELYAYKHNYKIKRNKRKPVRTKPINNDFDNYVQIARYGFTLTFHEQSNLDSKIQIDYDTDELKTLWRNINDETLKKAGVFVLLQKYLQPVVENFILYDKIVYLTENGIKCCFKKIFDEKLSPRCLVLIANK